MGTTTNLNFSLGMCSSIIDGRGTDFHNFRLSIIRLERTQRQVSSLGLVRLVIALVNFGLVGFYFDPYHESYEWRGSLSTIYALKRY